MLVSRNNNNPARESGVVISLVVADCLNDPGMFYFFRMLTCAFLTGSCLLIHDVSGLFCSNDYDGHPITNELTRVTITNSTHN